VSSAHGNKKRHGFTRLGLLLIWKIILHGWEGRTLESIGLNERSTPIMERMEDNLETALERVK